jgi:hypothetical protein
MPEEPKIPLAASLSDVSLNAAESQDKIDGSGTPKRKKKAPFKPLSIEVLVPLIVDRTDLQSPIKVDNPEFVALAPVGNTINSPVSNGEVSKNENTKQNEEKRVNQVDQRDTENDLRVLPISGSGGAGISNPPGTTTKVDTSNTNSSGTGSTAVSAPQETKQAPATLITQVQPSIITQVTPQAVVPHTAAQKHLAAAKTRAGKPPI